MPTEIQKRFCSLVANSATRGYIKKVVCSKCSDSSVKRGNGSLFEKDGKIILQIELLKSDGKAIHKNILPSDTASLCSAFEPFYQINLIGDGCEAEYRRSKSGSEVILGESKFLSAVANYGKKIEVKAHNRAKSYVFDGSEPFLYELGVADKNGRVYDKKQPKFRQINRFIEHIVDICKYLPGEGEINVLDLCCGKSYLSFAVYHYLTVTLGRKVNMTGIDLKSDVIAFCNDTSKNLGYSGLTFCACDINEYKYTTPVHLVVSLHACDVATDIVLSKAIELGAKVILSTPCCQQELLANLQTDEFEFITKYPILKKKLCDALTDALRLSRLEACGYNVTALEFTDPDDTPKNILLRAVRNDNFDIGSPAAKMAKDSYIALCNSLVGDKKLFIKG